MYANERRNSGKREPKSSQASPRQIGQLPEALRTGLETLSGVDLSGVAVHRNSPRPAEMGAEAFARNADIHLAPGREHRLAHEAWHVVQQAQGRVPPTASLPQGASVNDDSRLEREADTMGAKALGVGTSGAYAATSIPTSTSLPAPPARSAPGAMPSSYPRGASVVQGYFTDKSKVTPFKTFMKASAKDIELVRSYMTWKGSPDLDEFNELADDNTTDHGTLQAWVEENLDIELGALREQMELRAIQAAFRRDVQPIFPQTQSIPASWVVSTTTHNPGGPPILVEPEEIDEPNASQHQEMQIEDDEVKPTDLVVDLTRDQLQYHRGGQLTLTPDIRSDVRSGAMLTNSFVDYSSSLPLPRPLTGQSTKPIQPQSAAILKEARKQNEKRSEGKTLSHHPDTFWTGQPHSGMGLHPVNKTANTLDGDYHQLWKRTGTPLTGIVTKEQGGFTRPTLEAYNSHRERAETSASLQDQLETASLNEVREIYDEAETLLVTEIARNRWRELGDVLERLELAVSEEGATEGEGTLGSLADHYLEQVYDNLPTDTSSSIGLLDAIAGRLREL
jgi:hypothetical protein